MKDSKIAWTDNTFNPWIGCTRISEGCLHCYAESQDHRWGNDRWGKGKARKLTSKSNWDKVLVWNKEARESGKSVKVFCASMADIFDQEVSNEWRVKVFELIQMTPYLDWLLLTKRAYEQRNFINSNYPGLRNVWAGVTVENQENEWRIDDLEKTNCAVRWISYEPAIGPLSIRKDILVDWIICGGESGNGARPFNLRWARNLRDQCKMNGKAFFMKQLGANWHGETLEENEMDWKKKWDDPEEWPEDLRMREFPNTERALK